MIFIKDFTMPETCNDCPIQDINGDCSFTGNYVYHQAKRDCDCPLADLGEIFYNILDSKGGPGLA